MERSLQSRFPSVEVDHNWSDARRRGTSSSQRLLVAIMRRAIWDFVLYRDADDEERKALCEDATGWLFWDGAEKTDQGGRYTFLYICESLDLDPKKVRTRALNLTREEIQKLNNHIKEE